MLSSSLDLHFLKCAAFLPKQEIEIEIFPFEYDISIQNACGLIFEMKQKEIILFCTKKYAFEYFYFSVSVTQSPIQQLWAVTQFILSTQLQVALGVCQRRDPTTEYPRFDVNRVLSLLLRKWPKLLADVQTRLMASWMLPVIF